MFFFTLLDTRRYRAFMKIMNGHGVLLAIADGVKICAPPSDFAEIVSKIHALAMSEAGLTTQASKNRVYVKSSARVEWIAYLDASPLSEEYNTISLDGIMDGRLPNLDEFDEAFYVPNQGPHWPEADGINILGTPLGSPAFAEQYLQGKLKKHELLLSLIENVAKDGYSREAHKMMTGSTAPRLTHILKNIPKDESSTNWMKAVEDAHLTTWMKCVGAETLDATLPPIERAHLAALIDLPLQFGGVGLQSIIRAADEELLRSWSSITSDLIIFCRYKDLPVYSKLAYTLDSMTYTPDDLPNIPAIPAIETMLTTSTRAHFFLDNTPEPRSTLPPPLSWARELWRSLDNTPPSSIHQHPIRSCFPTSAPMRTMRMLRANKSAPS
jgi:hypothetical protein